MKSRKDAGVRKARGIIAGALALFALLYLPVDTSTESMTLTTYYPAPYGVYQKMRSTGETYLAYTSGGVGVGTTEMSSSGSEKLRVVGNTLVEGNMIIKGTPGKLAFQGATPATYLNVSFEEKTITGFGPRQVIKLDGSTGPGVIEGDIMVGPSNYLHMACSWVAYSYPGSTFCPGGTRANFMGDVPNSMGGHSITGWMGCCRLNTI